MIYGQRTELNAYQLSQEIAKSREKAVCKLMQQAHINLVTGRRTAAKRFLSQILEEYSDTKGRGRAENLLRYLRTEEQRQLRKVV